MRGVPLLTWADKKNPRAVREPGPRPRSETSLQLDLVGRLRKLEKLGRINDGWLWTHFPAGGRLEGNEGGFLRAMGTLSGVSDLLFMAPASPALGRKTMVVHGLELKAGFGTLSKEQEVFAGWLVRNGGKFRCVRSVQAALDTLVEWSVINRF